MEGVMGGIVKNQMQGKLKESTKDVKFKSLYTWARVSGFVCTLIVLGLAGQQLSTPYLGCPIFAIVAGLFTFFCEVICCFKCCTATKACATKIDNVFSYGPFFKAALYFIIAISGFIAYHYEYVVHNADNQVAVLFDFILYAVPGVMYILAFIVTDKCKLRKPGSKNNKTSDIEEQFDNANKHGPHEYVKKNLFSKACKVCDEPNAEACAEAQKEAAAAAAAASQKDNPFAKVGGSFKSLGARMSNGFKDLGAKMKIGTPRDSRDADLRKAPLATSPVESSANSGEENPFAKRKSKAKTTVTASKDVEENPFL